MKLRCRFDLAVGLVFLPYAVAMFEPVQPYSYSVLVPTSQAATIHSLLSLRSGGNYLDGYYVRQVGANSIQFTRQGLVALVRQAEVLTVNVYQRGDGSYLCVHGRAARAVAAQVNIVIGRLLGGLDAGGRELLQRAQRARETVLASRVYAENLLEHAADEMTLRYHEREISVLLHDIARLRAQLPRGQAAGPMTSAVLDPQHRILTQAQESAESRVRAMERYAAQVKAADGARLDWENAVRLSGLNDRFLDLAARTAADEHAIGELKNLTEQAAAAAEAFRDSLRQASMAAGPLVLSPQNLG